MEKYSYTPKGVCSRQFNFEIEVINQRHVRIKLRVR